MNLSSTFGHSGANLTEKLAEAEARVRANAVEAKSRVYLFQLLCTLGQWERALVQLQVCAQLDPGAVPMAQTYREAIRCERAREAVFAGQKMPGLLDDAPAWVSILAEALTLEPTAARDRRQQALDAAVEVPGQADGRSFGWIADGDSRLGPVCEAIAGGRYWWLPFEQIDRMVLEPPQDLRDLVWMAGTVHLRNGATMAALLPARYPGSGVSGDDAVASARITRWEEIAPDCWCGSGQKMWVTDDEDVPLLECRSLLLQGAPA